MSIWSRIGEVLARLPGAGAAGAVIDRIAEVVRGTFGTEARRQVAFTVSMIALSAKMAKADGVVSPNEIAAFERLFVVPRGERRNVERLFRLAMQDVAGYDVYARRIRDLHSDDCDILCDILDGLFSITTADGLVHEREIAFLAHVAELFGFSAAAFERIKARHVAPSPGDPFVVLGLPRGSSAAEIKRQYRQLVGETHPDRMIARGVPPEFVALANRRLAAINVAYAQVIKELQAA